MTILQPSTIQGRVEALLIGEERSTGLEKHRVPNVTVTFAGFFGDCHAGLTRQADVRVRKQYAKDTVIRNTRQVSILSAEELQEIARAMEIPQVLPEWLGANLVIAGIPTVSLLPGSTRLLFSSGAALVVDTENGPCRFPADIIERHYPGRGMKFIAAATHKRGVTAWVEKEGDICRGDTIAIHLPPQRHYSAGAG